MSSVHQTTRRVHSLLDDLPPREGAIIRRRYGLDGQPGTRSLNSLSRCFNLSILAVQAILDRGRITIASLMLERGEPLVSQYSTEEWARRNQERLDEPYLG